MPREKDPFWKYVKVLPNESQHCNDQNEKSRWKCFFCGTSYSGSATRIKAHLAGVGGYGINDCKDVDGRVKSEALKAFKKKTVESSNRPDNVEEGPHQPVIASYEDGRGETSFADMPYPSSDAIGTVGASSSDFLLLDAMNVQSQYLSAQAMTTDGDFSFSTQLPQSHAGDSNIQPRNSSYLRSGRDLTPEALTNVPRPMNAEEGEPNTEVPQDARTDDALVDSRPGTFGLLVEYLSTLKRKLDELSSRVANSDELETWWRKAKRLKGDYSNVVQAFGEGGSLSPQLVKRVDDLNKEVEDILGNCSLQKWSTTHAARWRKSLPLETIELVGRESKETIKKICHYLINDHIVIIGVYGMGGVGKTAILMDVHNRVLENPAFNDVFWVTVPEEFSVCKLQDEIADAVGLDNLSKDRDVKRRASILKWHLKKKRAILILDGLWMHFDIRDVGIPVEKGGIKMVLTTQSLDVCHKMLCQKQIEIRPLYEEGDSRDLFLKTLRFGRDLPSQIKNIATSILVKCGGLPLGIIEIATHMRGAKEVHEWKDLLQKLEKSMMELNVLKKLKLSYMNLGNLQVKQCFLHLILCFGEYFSEYERQGFTRRVIIESFIDEGLLSGIATRQELYDKGNIILDKIKKACLGVDIDGDIYGVYPCNPFKCPKNSFIHPLIKDMALQIVTSTTHMVKANMGLKEIPKEELWTDHLEKVFLQGNEIKEIPSGISPNSPKLMRLSLNCNKFLQVIHESFFRHLKGLKVLDFSYTGLMELPETISHLESLEALLLQGCKELRHIPCVQKLESLRKLDLHECAILEEVPEGMEMLVKLSYLNLYGTQIETLSEEVLGKWVNLQYLAIKKGLAWPWRELKKVEGLYCSVTNVETFNALVRFLDQNSSRPYELWLNELGDESFRVEHERHIIIESCQSITARVSGEISGDGCAQLPKNVQVLEVGWCDGMTSLCQVGPLDDLEKVEIDKWEELEELGAIHFPHLRRLDITRCSKLKHLSKEEQGLPRLQWLMINDSKELEGINIAAPFLYGIEVYKCPEMKRVVEWEWLAKHLPRLRFIRIGDCEKLEEIIGGSVSFGATCYLTEIEIERCNNLKGVLMTHEMLVLLPFLRDVTIKKCEGIEVIIGTVPNMTQPCILNLTQLTLWHLPELKSICDGTMSSFSIQDIDISCCPKLERLPLLYDGLDYYPHSLDSLRIDQLTWQSLEWHDPFYRSALEHLVRFPEWSSIWHDPWIAVGLYKEIRGDGHNLLPQNVQVMTVGMGSVMTSLSEVGPLEDLEELTIESSEKLEELGAVYFPHLRKLNIKQCSKLKHLSVAGQGLPCLRQFIIMGLEELEGIDLAAPNLKYIEVFSCPKMKRVVEWGCLVTHFPILKSIKICGCKKLEKIIGGSWPIGATCLLTKIEISGCNNMQGVLLTYDQLSFLPFLRKIEVNACKGIEVIMGTDRNKTFPKLTHLTVEHLPELKRICDQMESCDNIQVIKIIDCPKLERIPLQLRPLDNGLLSPPPFLRKILIEKETWQALEWDRPLAPISLEPLVHFDW